MYREFCKFLDKRFIRTFKLIGGSQNPNNTSLLSATLDQSSNVNLDTPLTKEASLDYVIRKSAELNLDLRSIFLKNDEHDLSVIPRARFLRILD